MIRALLAPGYCMPEFSTLALVDRETFDSLTAEIGLPGMRNLVEMFFREAEGRLAALRDLAVRDVDAIRFQTHALHGSGGMFGLTRLSALLRRLHDDAGRVAAEDYQHSVRRLTETFVASRTALADVLGASRESH